MFKRLCIPQGSCTFDLDQTEKIVDRCGKNILNLRTVPVPLSLFPLVIALVLDLQSY